MIKDTPRKRRPLQRYRTKSLVINLEKPDSNQEAVRMRKKTVKIIGKKNKSNT